MLVKDILGRTRTAFSFEFFPPKADGEWDALFQTIADLRELEPSYVSVTYGAGGSTRERTHNLVVRIQQETGITVVSHLTCVNAPRPEIQQVLERYDDAGVHNILALRGDPPKGQPWTCAPDGFPFAADLVTFIKKHFPHMGVAVAGFPEGHPGTPNRLQEMDHLKAKVDAGADYIVTQLFFDNRDFYDFCERCELAGITVPIIAGIMPISTRAGMVRMAELAAGARIPAALLRAVQRAKSDADVARVGTHWATEQTRDLVDHGVRGIHFYTLNKANATRQIHENLAMKGAIL